MRNYLNQRFSPTTYTLNGYVTSRAQSFQYINVTVIDLDTHLSLKYYVHNNVFLQKLQLDSAYRPTTRLWIYYGYEVSLRLITADRYPQWSDATTRQVETRNSNNFKRTQVQRWEGVSSLAFYTTRLHNRLNTDPRFVMLFVFSLLTMKP